MYYYSSTLIGDICCTPLAGQRARQRKRREKVEAGTGPSMSREGLTVQVLADMEEFLKKFRQRGGGVTRRQSGISAVGGTGDWLHGVSSSSRGFRKSG